MFQPAKLTAIAAFVALLVVVPASTGKTFRPGDVSVCGNSRCVSLRNGAALDALSRFYYGSPAPRPERRPAFGTPDVQLRYRNGYITGIVAGRMLDRFLSYGVNLDQFIQGTWYRVPPAAAREIRRLAARVQPWSLGPADLAYSH